MQKTHSKIAGVLLGTSLMLAIGQPVQYMPPAPQVSTTSVQPAPAPVAVSAVELPVVSAPTPIAVGTRPQPRPQPRPVTLGLPSTVTLADQQHCLAQNIYFESRGESRLGQTAVAWTTLNRVKHPDFPDSICEVVWQPWQFSWTRDGVQSRTPTGLSWDVAVQIAESVTQSWQTSADPTEGSVYFHATSVKPSWSKSFTRVVQIDNHIFYTDQG